MDDVDKMILECFLRLKCSFCEETTIYDLNELSVDNVVEATVRFLWTCDPILKKTIPSYKLPTHTTARYKIAANLAEELKKIGIRDEYGYQTFLYHNIFDLRRLFLALIDKLPEESLLSNIILTPMEQLKADVGGIIEKDLTRPWVSEFCRFLRMKYDGKFWHPNEEQPEDISFCTYKPSIKKFDSRLKICSIIAWNAGVNTDDNNFSSETAKLNFQELNLNCLHKEKPKLLPKPPKHVLNSTSSKNKDQSNVNSSFFINSLPSPSLFSTTLDSPCDELMEAISAKQKVIEEKRRELIELRYAQVRFEKEIESLKSKECQTDQRLLQLLSNPEKSIQKLQKIVNDANLRRVELQESFFKIHTSKTSELENLKRLQGISDSSCDHELELVVLQQKVMECEALIIERSKIKAKLEKELKKISSGPKAASNRSKYVTRVLEIVANVNKQNEEILKTVKSVKKLEYEIKSLSENLDRSFIVVNGWLEIQSESDLKMQRAYRLLFRMHEKCALIKSAINEKGQISRNIDELSNQIENENSMDSQMELVLNDLIQIRQENQELALKLKQYD